MCWGCISIDMYNPFPLLSRVLLKDQVAGGKRYFVRQTYARGRDARVKNAFLLRGYGADEKEIADRHMEALSRDGNAFLYDATEPAHLERLGIAAGQPFGYKVFYAAKKGVDWKPPPPYAEKIRRYILSHHPAWQLQRDGGQVAVGLYEEFGELFLKFNHGEKEEIIPFHIIETI